MAFSGNFSTKTLLNNNQSLRMKIAAAKMNVQSGFCEEEHIHAFTS